MKMVKFFLSMLLLIGATMIFVLFLALAFMAGLAGVG